MKAGGLRRFRTDGRWEGIYLVSGELRSSCSFMCLKASSEVDIFSFNSFKDFTPLSATCPILNEPWKTTNRYVFQGPNFAGTCTNAYGDATFIDGSRQHRRPIRGAPPAVSALERTQPKYISVPIKFGTRSFPEMNMFRCCNHGSREFTLLKGTCLILRMNHYLRTCVSINTVNHFGV